MGFFVCMGTDEPCAVRRNVKEVEIGWEKSEKGVHSHTDVATGKKKFFNHAEISELKNVPCQFSDKETMSVCNELKISQKQFKNWHNNTDRIYTKQNLDECIQNHKPAISGKGHIKTKKIHDVHW